VGGEDREDVYKVTGKITLAGAPVADANVSFSPKDKQPAAIGKTDSSGQYTLTTYDAADGAAAGEYVILVSKAVSGSSSDSSSASDPDDPNYGKAPSEYPDEESTSSLPEKYSVVTTTDLTATVKAEGENKFDFDLKP
jgi:hypothetical protein